MKKALWKLIVLCLVIYALAYITSGTLEPPTLEETFTFVIDTLKSAGNYFFRLTMPKIEMQL